MLFCNPLIGQTTDNSEPTVEIIELIKKTMDSKDSLSMEIQFTNTHNGDYKINSILELRKNQIFIKSHIKDMLNEESDISFEFSKTEFENELNRQLDALIEFNEMLILGGHYQKIKIDCDRKINTYETRKALGLMNLFDTGGLKYKKQ